MKTDSYTPATEPTVHFIGVTTASSSIMKVFPMWAKELRIDAVIKGIDFKLHDESGKYREAVRFILDDPLTRGALVTAHKLDLYHASKDLFHGLGPFASLIHETSCLVKRDGKLFGYAKDPLSCGLSLEAMVEHGYFKKTGGELCILGAGGSGTALSLYIFMTRDKNDLPSRIVVTNRSGGRLAELRRLLDGLKPPVPVEYALAPEPKDNDAVVSRLKPNSMVCNATGLGKDRPGSPLTERALFPEKGIVWDFNYRGDLLFLAQACRQREDRGLEVHDGWLYFIHGWTRAIAEIFSVDIPTSGPKFERLSGIAAEFRAESGNGCPEV